MLYLLDLLFVCLVVLPYTMPSYFTNDEYHYTDYYYHRYRPSTLRTMINHVATSNLWNAKHEP
jgi:hypothetical protein